MKSHMQNENRNVSRLAGPILSATLLAVLPIAAVADEAVKPAYTVPTEEQMALIQRMVTFYKTKNLDDVTPEAIEAGLGVKLERFGKDDELNSKFKILGVPDAEVRGGYDEPLVWLIKNPSTQKAKDIRIGVTFSPTQCFELGYLLSKIDLPMHKHSPLLPRTSVTYSSRLPNETFYNTPKGFGFGLETNGCIRGFGLTFRIPDKL